MLGFVVLFWVGFFGLFWGFLGFFLSCGFFVCVFGFGYFPYMCPRSQNCLTGHLLSETMRQVGMLELILSSCLINFERKWVRL